MGTGLIPVMVRGIPVMDLHVQEEIIQQEIYMMVAGLILTVMMAGISLPGPVIQ